MHKVGKLMFLAIGLGTSSMALADWDSAYYEGQEDCQYPYCRCTYSVYNGYRFTITIRENYCPYSIQVDLERGKWKK
ncbi:MULTISPECIES: hypothetical protein [Pasteurellaceae]|uniref:hypothetical protein n=1 Tax=Pasteurellaceae TaxID=712 RepID=UPI00356B3D9D